MKKNRKQIFLMGIYLAILSCLLVLQYCYIDGKMSVNGRKELIEMIDKKGEELSCQKKSNGE